MVSIAPGYIRHAWPEKAGFSIYRPNGIPQYSFFHFWNSFEIVLDGKVIKTEPHACIIYKAGTPQIYKCDQPAIHDWFRMTGDVEGLMHKYGLSFNTVYYPQQHDFITSLTRKLETENTVKDEYYKELSFNRINELFILFARAVSPDSQGGGAVNSRTVEQLKTLRRQLSLEYDKKWTISDMAKFINLSESYLYASYKRYYGVSPMQDLISIRIHQAITLLNDSDMPINEISEKLGYPSTSHFIRQFTKVNGTSPLKFRNNVLVSDRMGTHKDPKEIDIMNPQTTKMELIIHPDELTDRWIEKAKEMKLDRLALHPRGGPAAHESVYDLLDLLESEDFRAKADKLTDAGIELGYEFHALSYLLPRGLFAEHPEYFRMDDKGNRTTWGNFCFSNAEAREIICKNALTLAKALYKSCHEYYFWLDDAMRLTCHCEKCRQNSFAHHQLTLMNEIAAELKKEIPDAKVCYLAYYDGVAIPEEVKPAEGVFMEYAPFERYIKPETFAFEGEYLELVKRLIKFFGEENSKVLEYWYDNSIYFRRAGNKLVPFTPNNEQIKEDFNFYRELGFKRMSSFACNLCDEYAKLFGEPDFSAVQYREF
ncbi:MAG: DUF4838 domain-containing protein [Clostridia bacterium]|nr:DUF4838 domain-containing protein [Clostridia bacterium]